jgi:SEC-C motif domain protein
MSFGHAASRGTPAARIEDASPCPCGSGEHFGGCCGPLIGGADAPTAERLMRSRFTAFVLGDAGHLERSWHPRTRPDRVDLDPDLRWTMLEIVDAAAGSADDVAGVVEFRAHWKDRSGAAPASGVLHERSSFVRRAGRWFYLEGDVS